MTGFAAISTGGWSAIAGPQGKKTSFEKVFSGLSLRSVMGVTTKVLRKVNSITVRLASGVHAGHTSKHGHIRVLHRTALLLAVIAVSVVMLWVEGAAGPLARMIEQNFVALSLGLLIPLLAPWLK